MRKITALATISSLVVFVIKLLVWALDNTGREQVVSDAIHNWPVIRPLLEGYWVSLASVSILLICLWLEHKAYIVKHPIKVKFIAPYDLYKRTSVKIINGDKESRIASITLYSIKPDGNAHAWTKISELKGCKSLPHALAPQGAVEVTFQTSIGGFISNGHKKFYATVTLENEITVTTKTLRVFDPRKIKKLKFKSATPTQIPPPAPHLPPIDPPEPGAASPLSVGSFERNMDTLKNIFEGDDFKRQIELSEKAAKAIAESIRSRDAAIQRIENKQESYLRIELDRNNNKPNNHIKATVFNKSDASLKIQSFKLIVVRPSGEESIQDGPGLIDDGTDYITEVPSNDRKDCLFQFTDAELWKHEPDVTEYYVKMELRNGSICKSEPIKRPSANPDVPLANKFRWSRIATAMEDRVAEIKERLVPRGDLKAVGTELALAAMEVRDPNLPEIHCIESDLIADANSANRDTGWTEFREMAMQAEKLNGQINTYNQVLMGGQITERTLESLVEMLGTPENILIQVVKLRAKIAAYNM